MRRALAACILVALTGGCSRLVEGQYRAAEQSRVKDAVGDYERARNRGDRVAICVEAGVVASAYADAQDEPNQQAWAARRKEDCRSAYTPLTRSEGDPVARGLDGSR
jgi:hypothetical protein